MKLGTLLLGTAAGLMVASAAQAADLPGEPVPAAVDYVKVCDAFGAGFFYIPGTETCLDISGRVRFRVQYNGNDGDDNAVFRADARLQFDARTATEYGTLRSFIEITEGSAVAGGQANMELNQAFIQLGYLTVGLHDDLANGDVLFGDDGHAYFTGDNTRVGITVLVDDLGGGFYAGAGVYSNFDGRNNVFYSEGPGDDFDAEIHAAVGISGQPWGGIDLSAVYRADSVLADIWTVKATANLTLAEGIDARLVAAYGDAPNIDDADVITLAGAVYASVSDAAAVYAGLRYDLRDDDDTWGVNAGVDYTVTSGLVLTAEANYFDNGDADDTWKGMLQLSRTW